MLTKFLRKIALKLVRRYLLKPCKFKVGDVITPLYNKAEFEVSAIFYTAELMPVVLVHDKDGRLHGVDQHNYKSIYKSNS
jgi:hypothetical protein